MKEGSQVRLKDAPDITATIVQMPRSIGRKNKRAKVRDENGVERWLPLEDLELLP